MKLTKGQQEFIKEAHSHSDVCVTWKTKIKDAFPKLFNNELEVGKWYKYGGLLANYKDKETAYGFGNNGKWYDESKDWEWIKDSTLATNKEVETALIKEAKKKGFKEGVKVRCLNDDKVRILSSCDMSEPNYEIDIKGGFNLGTSTVMLNGKWATIIEDKKEMTISEIQKELGYNIKIIK